MALFRLGKKFDSIIHKSGLSIDKIFKNGNQIFSKNIPDYITTNMIVWVEPLDNGAQDLSLSTTSLRDKSGHNRHVTLYNAKWSNASITMSGKEDCYGVFTNLSMNTRSSFTICATFKILDIKQGNVGIVCTKSTGANRFFFGHSSSYVQNVTSPADVWWGAGNFKVGEIAYVCMTFAHEKDKNSSFNIYKNGVLIGSNPNMGMPTTNWDTNVELCRSWGGTVQQGHPNANIQLYDLVMYDGCLTAEQIKNNWLHAKDRFGISRQGILSRITFNVTPSNATVVVKDLAGNVINPVANNTYDLTTGTTYNYTLSASGYQSLSDYIDVIKNKNVVINLSRDYSTITFADATDSELREMLQAHNNGTIDLSKLWKIGDTRKIHLNAIQDPDSNRASNTWSAQDITISIVEFNRYNITGTSRKAPLVVQTRECLNNLTSGSNEIGTISPSLTGAFNTVDNWRDVPMRSWLNNQFFNTVIPNGLKDLIPSVKRTVITGSQTFNTTTVDDRIFLPTHPEIWGSTSSSTSMYYPSGTAEGARYTYYNTASNRKKFGNNNGSSNGNPCHWYIGSPSKYSNYDWKQAWCCTDNTGGDNAYYADSHNGLAPAFCLGL